jgi:ABC-type branched-subunit amino acid transport system ATPase component
MLKPQGKQGMWRGIATRGRYRLLQVGKSVLSGKASDPANDPRVQKAYLGIG